MGREILHAILWDYTAPEERRKLASYVLEGLDEIVRIVKKAEDDLEQIPPRRDPCFNGYVDGGAERVSAQVEALFRRLQKTKPREGKRLTYRDEPPDAPPGRQRLRLAREILHNGNSECLGWVTLLAACALQVRLNPLIVVTRNKRDGGHHAIFGYWLSEQCFSRVVVDGKSVEDRLKKGQIGVVNATRIAVDENGGLYTFDKAEAEARDELLPPRNPDWEIRYAIDLRAAREQGVEPLLPLRPWSGNHPLALADAFQKRPELNDLRRFWRNRKPSGAFALVGIGGAGKTSLVHRFLAQLPGSEIGGGAERDSSLPVPDALFVWDFYEYSDSDRCATALYNYLTGKRVRKATFEQVQQEINKEWRGCRVLLVFDGVEKLQIASGAEPEKDGGTFGQFLPEGAPFARFLRWVCDGPRPVQVVVTSRLELTDLRRYVAGGCYRVVEVGDLPGEGARALLRARGVQGEDRRLDELAREFGNHAQTLDLLGNALRLFCGGQPARVRDLPPLENPDRFPGLGDQAWKRRRVLRFYEQELPREALAVLQWLCLFHIVPATKQWLTDIFLKRRGTTGGAAKIESAELQSCLLSLCRHYRLVSAEPLDQPEKFSVHPAVREYFYESIKKKAVLHGRVREYLAEMTSSINKPVDQQELDLLEELVYQCLGAHRESEAFDVFVDKMGSYSHLASNLGDYARGKRVVSLFAGKSDFDFPASLGLEKRARLLNAYGGFCRELGELSASARALEETLRIGRGRQGEYNISVALRNLPLVFLLSGHLSRARAAVAEAIARMDGRDDIEGSLISYAISARLHSLKGDVTSALDDFLAAAELRQTGSSSLAGRLGVWQAELLLRLGRIDEAVRMTEWNLKESERRWVTAEPRCQLLLAEVARRAGDHSEARELIRKAMEKGMETSGHKVILWACLAQARLTLDLDNLLVAEQALQEGLRIAEHCGYGIYYIDLLVTRGQLRLEQCDFVAAAEDARAALNGRRRDGLVAVTHHEPVDQLSFIGARHPECGYVWGACDALHLLEQVMLAQGRREEAHRVLQERLTLRPDIQAHGAGQTW